MISIKKKKIIGICLGMQLLMTSSEEFGKTKGLNLIQGSVKKFHILRIVMIDFLYRMLGGDIYKQIKTILLKNFYTTKKCILFTLIM